MVHLALKAGRAMTLCWRPKSAISAMSMTAASSGARGGADITVRPANGEIADEDDQIKKGREEDRVADNREQHGERT